MKIECDSTDTLEESWSKAWPGVKKAVSPIKNRAQLAQKNRILDALLEKIGDEENHPLAALCDMIAGLIEDYESRVLAIEPSSPREILKFLMDQHGLKQTSLSDIIPQSNLSAVLKGRRNLTAKQIALLAARFNVSPALFLPKIRVNKQKAAA